MNVADGSNVQSMLNCSYVWMGQVSVFGGVWYFIHRPFPSYIYMQCKWPTYRYHSLPWGKSLPGPVQFVTCAGLRNHASASNVMPCTYRALLAEPLGMGERVDS
jgi:hypothetical protein